MVAKHQTHHFMLNNFACMSSSQGGMVAVVLALHPFRFWESNYLFAVSISVSVFTTYAGVLLEFGGEAISPETVAALMYATYAATLVGCFLVYRRYKPNRQAAGGTVKDAKANTSQEGEEGEWWGSDDERRPAASSMAQKLEVEMVDLKKMQPASGVTSGPTIT
jgi:hypothetical protein